MSRNLFWSIGMVSGMFLAIGVAQQSAPSAPSSANVAAAATVPNLVNYNGTVSDLNGKPLAGVTGVTFLLYRDQQGGTPLWMETQNVTPDRNGRYMVTLGTSRSEGLPADVFASGEARWLGVEVVGQAEQPRVLLVAVPYALKAADAQTLGGLPASAFALAGTVSSGTSISGSGNVTATSAVTPPPTTSSVTTTGGTVNTLPLWTTATNVQSSAITQTGTGATARIGIGTVTPATTLDVKGAETLRGALKLTANGTATAVQGASSQVISQVASSFSSTTSTAVNQTFQWRAEPAGNNTPNPSGTLNLLYGLGSTAPAETGLKIATGGLLTFAPGQTFPGTGSGTVTSVAMTAPASDFTVTGSPISNSGTLNLNWLVSPTNAATANAIVKRDANSGFSSGSIFATDTTLSGAVNGFSNADAVIGSSPSGHGVYGTSATGQGVGGTATTSGDGVAGYSVSGRGVYGNVKQGQGVVGESFDTAAVPNLAPYGVEGYSHNGYATSAGVAGINFASSGGYGLYGYGFQGGYFRGTVGVGVVGFGGYGTGYTQPGDGGDFYGGSGDVYAADGIFARWGGGGVNAVSYAGFFDGNVFVNGNLAKSGGSFKIDHPLDPANKYLSHSFVESPDMMNIYNGNTVLDNSGEAVIELPEWFEKLNRDFRYQLTPIRAQMSLYVAEEISSNRFRIAGGRPGGKVSWQVTGIRQDEWANSHRISVEEVKPERERGFYLHPELFGAPEEKAVVWSRHPEALKHIKDQAAKAKP